MLDPSFSPEEARELFVTLLRVQYASLAVVLLGCVRGLSQGRGESQLTFYFPPRSRTRPSPSPSCMPFATIDVSGAPTASSTVSWC